jgi:hypothetical protein
LDGVVLKGTILLACSPREWLAFLVKFRESGPVKLLWDMGLQEIGWQLKGSWRVESFNASFFERIFTNWAKELTVSIVRPINWLERNEFQGIGRKHGCVLFLESAGRLAVFQSVRSTVKLLNNSPWTSHGVHKFPDTVFFGIRASGTASKNDVTNLILTWIWAI